MHAGPRRYRAAVFDMDGLLLDSERPIREAWLRLSREAGTPLDAQAYARTIGRNRPDTLALMAPLLGGEAQALRLYEAVDAAVQSALVPRGFAPMPGAVALLHALRQRGVPCVVASSSRHAKVVERLETAGLASYFDALHGGDQVARGKPHPDLFERAAESLGLPGTRCLVFEDSSLGAQGALQAGMGVVLVPDLKDPDPVVAAQCLIIDSLDQALPQLPAWFGA